MKYFIFTILAFVSCGLYATDCTSPAGKPGTMLYMGNDYKYCNKNGLWLTMANDGPHFNNPCTKAGLISGNSFCNGTKLIYMDSSIVTGIACGNENELRYNPTSGKVQICISNVFNDVGSSAGMTINDCSQYHDSTSCYANNCDWIMGVCNELATGGGVPISPI